MAAGCPVTDIDPHLHEIAKFLPEFTRRTDPVRAVIGTQYPKLAAALDSGLKTEASVNAAIGFLSKAVAKKRAAIKTVSELNELRRASREYRARQLGHQGKYDRNNTGMSGWKVCK